MLKIHRGKRPAPDRILLYAREGVGKSTFASGAPSPIFIAAEDGVRYLDVASIDDLKTWDHILVALNLLATEKHDFKTVVIDTLDWVEHLLRDKICQDNNWTPKDFVAYGQGYKVALEYWRQMQSVLERIHAVGMEIILLVHAAKKTMTNPGQPTYQVWAPNLGGDAGPGLWNGWVDCVLFAQQRQFIEKGKTLFAKGNAFTDGTRFICTKGGGSWDAKNRYSLPEEIPLNYADYAAARDAGLANLPAMIEEAEALLVQMAGSPRLEGARKYIAENSNNATNLAKAISSIRTIIEQTAASTQETKETTHV